MVQWTWCFQKSYQIWLTRDSGYWSDASFRLRETNHMGSKFVLEKSSNNQLSVENFTLIFRQRDMRSELTRSSGSIRTIFQSKCTFYASNNEQIQISSLIQICDICARFGIEPEASWFRMPCVLIWQDFTDTRWSHENAMDLWAISSPGEWISDSQSTHSARSIASGQGFQLSSH
jgi:hypothetical protein